eukprot:m.29541 g.29541  ORF g.29541 m.29541 type:complete len:78 (+) comp11953_c0_seq2:1264-1497(+)
MTTMISYAQSKQTRGDCTAMRPCHEACPVFARELRQAVASGLKVLVYNVSFNEDGTVDWCGRLPFVLPELEQSDIES